MPQLTHNVKVEAVPQLTHVQTNRKFFSAHVLCSPRSSSSAHALWKIRILPQHMHCARLEALAQLTHYERFEDLPQPMYCSRLEALAQHMYCVRLSDLLPSNVVCVPSSSENKHAIPSSSIEHKTTVSHHLNFLLLRVRVEIMSSVCPQVCRLITCQIQTPIVE